MQADRIDANHGQLAAAVLSSGRFNREPALAELFSDPMTQAIMAADHVRRTDLEALLQQKRAQLAILPQRPWADAP